MTSKSRIGKIAFAAALVAASGGAALGLTSIASASLGSSAPAVESPQGAFVPQGAPADATATENGMRRGPVTENLAKVLKLSVDELHTELAAGKTIAQIAEAQKVDIDDVTAVMIADFKAHLDEEVASGEHTQAEADAKLKEFESRLDDIVNGVRPPRGDHSDAPAAEGTPSTGASFSA